MSEIQFVACPTEPLSLADADASDDAKDDPTIVIDTLPDEGRFTFKEVEFKTNKEPETNGRLNETDELMFLENPTKETCIPIYACIPETIRHIKELSAFQTVDAAALNPNRMENLVIEWVPNPVPEISAKVEPLAGALKPWRSNVCWSKVYIEEDDDCRRVNDTIDGKLCPTPETDFRWMAESDSQTLL